ncbi:MAG: hypothetical protein KDA33_01185 [Phycisphaerales bacterium]|nr:hypothetical protein [Phycisphaerales bacterium]
MIRERERGLTARPRGSAHRWTYPAIILSLHICLANASLAQTPDAAVAPMGPGADVSTQTPTESPEKKSASQPYVQVGIDDRITLHISGLPLSDALRMLSEPTKKNIILGPGAEGVVSATLYDATFDEALRAMLVANGLGYVSEGNFIYIHPIAEIEKMKSSSRKVVTRVVHLSYARAVDVQALIEPLRSESGSIAMTPPSNIGLGGDAGPADTEGNVLATADTIVITDYSDVVERMLSIIREVDTRPQQALIEATILRATLNENNAMGIDFTVVGGIDFTALNSTSPAAQSITTGQTPQNVMGDTTLTARTNFNNAVPGGGFTFGIIKDQIGVFVRALEA